MRAVIQRVTGASVSIDGMVTGAIECGLVILLGIEETDTPEDIAWLSGKIVRLRIINDQHGVMNRSVTESGGGILLVSQFTLLASTKRGNRPSYARAARIEVAVPLYESFIQKLTEDLGRPIQTGTFGADMKVWLVNDGPVTIMSDSKSREQGGGFATSNGFVSRKAKGSFDTTRGQRPGKSGHQLPGAPTARFIRSTLLRGIRSDGLSAGSMQLRMGRSGNSACHQRPGCAAAQPTLPHPLAPTTSATESFLILPQPKSIAPWSGRNGRGGCRGRGRRGRENCRAGWCWF